MHFWKRFIRRIRIFDEQRCHHQRCQFTRVDEHAIDKEKCVHVFINIDNIHVYNLYALALTPSRNMFPDYELGITSLF